MSNGDHERNFVTNADLEHRLDKIPTRWEVIAMISGALVVNQFLPTVEVSKAMVKAVIGVFT